MHVCGGIVFPNRRVFSRGWSLIFNLNESNVRSMAISGRTEDRDRPDVEGILVLILLSKVEMVSAWFCLDHMSFRRYFIFHLIYHGP
jgi:hypothetical protein